MIAASHSSLVRALEKVAASVTTGAVELVVQPAEVRLDVPEALAVRAISPVAENAVRFASTTVTVSSRVRHGSRDLPADRAGCRPLRHSRPGASMARFVIRLPRS